MNILLLMILFHIIDDFVLQPVCLSKLKQKSFWEQNCNKDELELYKDDYKVALFIHALSWSIMISIPPMIFLNLNGFLLLLSVICNTIIHAYIDNLKANEHKINLMTDQLLHFVQILILFIFSI